MLEDNSDDFFIDGVKTRLTKAVKSRLKATSAKVCALLSGGVDSTVITAIAKKLKPDLVAFTFSVGDKGKADLHYARLAAKHLDVPLVEVVVTPEDVLKHLDEIIYMNEDLHWTQISVLLGNTFWQKRLQSVGIELLLVVR